MADKVNKCRQARGSGNGQAKLNEKEISEIRSSEEGPTALGKRYGVTAGAISHIFAGRNWSHVS